MTYKDLIHELDDIAIKKSGIKITLTQDLTFRQKEILKALDIDL